MIFFLWSPHLNVTNTQQSVCRSSWGFKDFGLWICESKFTECESLKGNVYFQIPKIRKLICLTYIYFSKNLEFNLQTLSKCNLVIKKKQCLSLKFLFTDSCFRKRGVHRRVNLDLFDLCTDPATAPLTLGKKEGNQCFHGSTGNRGCHNSRKQVSSGSSDPLLNAFNAHHWLTHPHQLLLGKCGMSTFY